METHVERLRDGAHCAGVSFLFLLLMHASGVFSRPDSLDLRRAHTVSVAMGAYRGDYEQFFPPNEYSGSHDYRNDRFWPSLVLPYYGTWTDFRTPTDPNANDASLGVDVNGKQCQSEQECQFDWSFRTNRGYNWQYLAPGFSNCPWNGQTLSYLSIGTSFFLIERPQKTILFVGSVWTRRGGFPSGGGNWVVDMPARTDRIYGDSLPPMPFGCQGRWWLGGWKPSDPQSPILYGAAWPWEASATTQPNPCAKFPVTFTDGSVKALTLGEITAGAELKDGWQGWILDRGAYLWDLK